MRRLILALALCILATSAFAAVPNTPHRPEKGLGNQQFSPAVSTALTLPALAKHVKISIRTNGVYYTDDGTAASPVNGGWLPAGTVLIFENDREYISKLRFISTEEGAAVVYAVYSGDR